MELVASVVVIAARQFNPSILTQLWLVRNGVVAEDDFEPGCLFADGISQVEAKQFRLVAIPQQLQFAPKVSEDAEQGIIIDKLGKIVRALPHTPYFAMGINFIYQQSVEDVGTATRHAFFRDDSPLFHVFDSPNSRFGGYMSKDWENMRLKLDIKPITVAQGNVSEERLMYTFNFHRDLQDVAAADQIVDCLNLWDRAKQASRDIAAKSIEEILV